MKRRGGKEEDEEKDKEEGVRRRGGGGEGGRREGGEEGNQRRICALKLWFPALQPEQLAEPPGAEGLAGPAPGCICSGDLPPPASYAQAAHGYPLAGGFAP